MRIHRAKIRNFRLLRRVEIGFEEQTTLIVGRNNSGKTSIGEIFRRLLSDRSLSFRLEDFSLGCHERFWRALQKFRAQPNEAGVLRRLPVIRLTLDIGYDVNAADLGPLSECIIDLNPDCAEARLEFRFSPKATALKTLFADYVEQLGGEEADRARFFRFVETHIQDAYISTLETVDPNDSTNRKSLELKILAALVGSGFINAQRGLDDDTQRERDVLGKVVEVLFQSALTDEVDDARRTTAEQLKEVVETIQSDVHNGFNTGLTSLLPAFDLFGYPGLSDPGLVTETNFDINKLLKDYTKVRYRGANGITLPETYSGLGTRNLVYMLLQLLRFFREFQATPTTAGVHLIFIEEPEAHLHPQMQEVFIRQLDHVASTFVAQLNADKPWPVQFMVTTHSSHIANEARFESLRYFLSIADDDGFRQSIIKDLRQGMGSAPAQEREFLHQYLTLSRCDLFFADKAVLIEGTAERLLLPAMIRKTDADAQGQPPLRRQYLTVMEVGGAYAHRFFDLLSFLQLRTLVITDIDSVAVSANGKRIAVPVAEGTFTSNACIKHWYEPDVSPAELLAKTPDEKVVDGRRLAFQIPETDGGPSARSFEDAFILANQELFELGEGDPATRAYELAAEQKKSSFALTHAIEQTQWRTPRYIAEGLRWLAEGNLSPVLLPEAVAAGIEADVVGGAEGQGDA
jgi:putative ATP-dependent endonuclease of the OLD family